MSGTVFGAFYDVVRRIPAGSVSTYGQVARLAGMPRSARLVGYAMASCQDPNRALPPGGGPLRRHQGGLRHLCPRTQRALLEAEGVAFRLDGTVDLEQCLWTPES